jgi:hypothetical protein
LVGVGLYELPHTRAAMSMDIAKKATTNGTILREMVISLPLSLNGLLDSVAPAPLPDASNE